MQPIAQRPDLLALHRLNRTLAELGRMYLRSTQRTRYAVLALQRTSTCSVRYRSATSATVGPIGARFGAATAASPDLIRAMISAARWRACSAVITPWRPTVTRLDRPRARV